MAIILTAQNAEQKLNLLLNIEKTIGSGKTYATEMRVYTHKDKVEIREKIVFWNRMLRKLSPKKKAQK